jgi:hypothetical protein
LAPLEYLEKRIKGVVLGSNKKYNEGCLLLARWSHERQAEDGITLQMMVDRSWSSLLRLCLSNKTPSQSNSTKLTQASMAIGKGVLRAIGEPEDDDTPEQAKSCLALGDLVLEAFLQCGLITIGRAYQGIKAPYLVTILNQPHEWVYPDISGTSLHRLGSVTGLRSEVTNDPFIKGWSDAGTFDAQIADGAVYLTALSKLRAQGWRLNLRVLEELRARPPETKIKLVEASGQEYILDLTKKRFGVVDRLPNRLKHEDGAKFHGVTKDPRVLRLLSKYIEYRQILDKADLLVEMLTDGGAVVDSRYSPAFWQEVSCDYRGRVYISEPFLNYQSSDLSRGLFLFEEGATVSGEGIDALLVHAANCYNASFDLVELKKMTRWTEVDYHKMVKAEKLDSISLDKLTFRDRIQYMERNLEKFIGHDAPIFQEHAEKPFSLFAALWEIWEYIQSPETYKSHLPVPIDGSNNGWQHLAAMSKDEEAGALVSLTDSEVQQDFYIRVAKEMKKTEPAWFRERKIPLKHVRKGIAKRGAMTRAYSAGRHKIAENMYADCHAEGYTTLYDIGEEDCLLLAGRLIEAVNIVCHGPLKTMKYFQKIVQKELLHRKIITWTSPSGFPVVYEVNHQITWKQRGTIRGIGTEGRINHVIKIDARDAKGEKIPSPRAFMTGISPNFVHSQDSAHMHLVISEWDGPFAGIHDSFATHASCVAPLKELVKRVFYDMYKEEDFFKKIREMIMTEPDEAESLAPQSGDLNIADVLTSRYFFS